MRESGTYKNLIQNCQKTTIDCTINDKTPQNIWYALKSEEFQLDTA